MSVSDQGLPRERTSLQQATVRVTVTRDTTSSPISFNQTYERTVREDIPSGTLVETVRADSSDPSVSDLETFREKKMVLYFWMNC